MALEKPVAQPEVAGMQTQGCLAGSRCSFYSACGSDVHGDMAVMSGSYLQQLGAPGPHPGFAARSRLCAT